MALALFNGCEYVLTTDKGDVELFREDHQHKALLDYVSKDLSQLPALLKQYVSKKMDIVTFDLKEYTYKPEDSLEINEILMNLHPYYRHESRAVFVNAIGDYFNALLLQSVRENRKNEFSPFLKYEKKWYLKRFEEIAVSQLKIGDRHPQDFNSMYEKEVGEDAGYGIEESIIFAPPAKGFKKEIQQQKIIKRMLFWILELSAQNIGELAIHQRVWLFMKIFGRDFAEHQMSVPKHLLLASPPRDVVNYDDGQETDYINQREVLFEHLYVKLNNFHVYQKDVSPDTLNALNRAIEYAKEHSKDGGYEQYHITSLHQLLFLEILKMIETDTKIKRCKNCGGYFVVTNLNMAFCSRVKDGEKKPCNVIGSMRIYEDKVKGDKALELYNRAYRTRHARVSKDKMSYDDFLSWCERAKEKRDEVRENKLNLIEFEKWLNEGIRGRKR